MKKIMMAFLVALPIFASAQKVDVKDGKILVDGKEYALIERSHGDFTVRDLSGNEAIIIRSVRFQDPTTSYSQPIVFYAEFIFLNSKQKAESKDLYHRINKMAEVVVKAKLFKDGVIDEEAVSRYVLINGTPFSDRIRVR
ncbi:hypothetical protein EPD60_10350 [Flaviaesturariibacter flavus]|uniref:DUF4369 domain-containing protein n=1 Tax=Flaviaesturariibacter flavus TaxID=2502780 RepID=A0A4R1BBJ1_9BACT|nr:hypothetical protein [Flaviaesturariibacter flavus]TCJ14385.1 hypothetical protein EPD60_10350 [Flaviaesturariibacter flavus]